MNPRAGGFDGELSLLLAAIRPEAEAPGPSAIELAQLASASLDWRRLVDQAIGHGVATRLYESLRPDPPSQAPDDEWQRLERHYFSVIGLNLPRRRQLVEALDALRRAGIAAVAFKGPLLSATLGRDPLTRESTDLDVLIDRSALARGAEVLDRLGYLALEPRRLARDATWGPLQKHYSYDPSDPAHARIELHAEVMEPEWAVELPTARLLSRAVPVDFDGTRLRQLDWEDLLVTVALHGTSHGWRRLMWVADLADLLARLPDERILRGFERAGAVHCRRLLASSCALVAALLGVRGTTLANELQRDPSTRVLASRWARRLRAPLAAERALRLPLADRLRIRERPRDTWRSARLHARLGWYLVRERLSLFRFGDGTPPTRSLAVR